MADNAAELPAVVSAKFQAKHAAHDRADSATLECALQSTLHEAILPPEFAADLYPECSALINTDHPAECPALVRAEFAAQLLSLCAADRGAERTVHICAVVAANRAALCSTKLRSVCSTDQ
jgi:hypothetical protein